MFCELWGCFTISGFIAFLLVVCTVNLLFFTTLFGTDPINRLSLNWEKRVQIIEGVTQGLLYLQEYSRLTVIHRDLKASNILLDDQMRPKIADFGMAKIFQKDKAEASTDRVVGTQ